VESKVGKPTGRTRALAEASRDRHIDAAKDDARLARLTEGFHAQSTLAELIRWWLDHIARHRVRITTWATYSKQLKLVEDRLGEIPVRQLRPEQVTTFVSELVDRGSAARARNVRTLLVQVLDQAVTLGLTTDNVARKVRPSTPPARSTSPTSPSSSATRTSRRPGGMCSTKASDHAR
jgi:hypothetical protein